MRIRVVLAGVVLASIPFWAQEYRGTFSGSVTDPQGSAVPKATVTALETRTGTKTVATTESTGEYTLPFLAPGEYEITAEAPGFKRTVRQGLQLSAGEHPVIDIHLDVGAVSDSVTVNAEAPLVVAADASVGQTVTTKEVEDIPVNGRSPIMLMTMAMGVLGGAPGPVRPFDLPGGGFIIGGINGSNEFLLDGAPNGSSVTTASLAANTTSGGASAYSPPQDSVMEFASNVFESDAAYGHAGGGIANLITRSGTNSIHGSAFGIQSGSAMDANSFFANRAGTARPAYHYNQYGLTLGGPLWIPKSSTARTVFFGFSDMRACKDSDPATSPLETGNRCILRDRAYRRRTAGGFFGFAGFNTPTPITPFTILHRRSFGFASGAHAFPQ